jgi:hypothetical protein
LARFEATSPSATLIADLSVRVSAQLPASLPLALPIQGPARLATFTGVALAGATQQALAAARFAAEVGARVVVVREDGEAWNATAEYLQGTVPLWASLHFFRGVGVLQISGCGDGWATLADKRAPLLCCFDPAASPGLTAAYTTGAVVLA